MIAVTGGAAVRNRLPRAARRPEFDVLRALVVAGLAVFHSAVVFASGVSWFVKDPRPAIGFTAFLLWGSLWGMPLLFVVSGMGARYAIKAVVNVQNYAFAVSQQAQTSLRSIIGQSELDQLLSGRAAVNRERRRIIDEPPEGPWGIRSSGWRSRTSRCPRT